MKKHIQSDKSKTLQIHTGCGDMKMIVKKKDGDDIRVAVTMGKNGGCSFCQAEGKSRLINIALKHGATIEEIIKELKDLGCSTPHVHMKEIPELAGQKKVSSCSDAIAQLLQLYLIKEKEDGKNDKKIS